MAVWETRGQRVRLGFGFARGLGGSAAAYLEGGVVSPQCSCVRAEGPPQLRVGFPPIGHPARPGGSARARLKGDILSWTHMYVLYAVRYFRRSEKEGGVRHSLRIETVDKKEEYRWVK
jgi:hypothetical protein